MTEAGRARPRDEPDVRREPPGEHLPTHCSYCRRALDGDESTIVLMRDGRVAAAFHERCHPHHRRSGCSAC